MLNKIIQVIFVERDVTELSASLPRKKKSPSFSVTETVDFVIDAIGE
jgi:hypothetical protein